MPAVAIHFAPLVSGLNSHLIRRGSGQTHERRADELGEQPYDGELVQVVSLVGLATGRRWPGTQIARESVHVLASP